MIGLWRNLPLGRDVALLNHDEQGVAALSKPAGVLSHPNRSQDKARALLVADYALAGEVYTWRSEEGGEERRLWLLNRLDAGTSGVILVAASEALADTIRAMFRARHVHKRYLALVFGVPTPPQQVWRDRLAVHKEGGRIRTETGGNVPAEAGMRLVQPSPPRLHPPISLIQLEPRTGRSHQLRAQCARRHLPIVGDATYGDFSLNRDFVRRTGLKRMFLHSWETTFDYEWQGRRHRFVAQAPAPKEFAAARAA